MGSSFSSGNHIYVHTTKPSYVGGDTVEGCVYMNVKSDMESKGISIKLSGHEKFSWHELYNRSETVGEGENTEIRRWTEEKSDQDKKEFFKIKVPCYDAHGHFEPGQYQFPFNFQIPHGLPGVFKDSNEGERVEGLRQFRPEPGWGNADQVTFWTSIEYKLKVECDVKHGEDLKHKQALIINERLAAGLTPVRKDGGSDVVQCCCINKGHAKLTAYFDKSAYMPGETAQVVCEVDNDSSVDLKSIKVKLMRTIELRDKHGHKKYQIVDTICRQDYEGVKEKTKCLGDQARRVPLRLDGRRGGDQVTPAAHGYMVKCEFHCEVELDVPMGSDVEIQIPMQIYASEPTPDQWRLQAPDGWSPQVMPSTHMDVPAMTGPPPPQLPPPSAPPPPIGVAPPSTHAASPPIQQTMGEQYSEKSPLTGGAAGPTYQ